MPRLVDSTEDRPRARPLPVQLTARQSAQPLPAAALATDTRPDAAPAARAFLTGVPALISPNAATRTARRGRWCVARKPQFAHTH
jgi:hypothetical protein